MRAKAAIGGLAPKIFMHSGEIVSEHRKRLSVATFGTVFVRRDVVSSSISGCQGMLR